MRTKKERELLRRMPQPGDFGLSTIGGFTGWWINLGQALIGDGARYTHAFIVVDEKTVIQAMPGGAEIADLNPYLGKVVFSNIDLTPAQRADITKAAVERVGTPYSFLDYLSLALLHWGIQPRWLKNYIKNKGHMICSQLVDDCYLEAGVHLFDDGRLSQDVTPGDLLYVIVNKTQEG